MTSAIVEGFPVLIPGSPLLHTWTLPGTRRRITLRNGSVGFCLAHLALRFHDKVERLDQLGEDNPDDGGYNYRKITGGSSWSKHATGAAEDLNWRKHPYGVAPGMTFSQEQIARIRRWLHNEKTGYALGGAPGLSAHRRIGPVIEWGGDWPSHPGSTAHPDAMHFQIHNAARMPECEALAKRLMETSRGRQLLQENPGQKRVILS